MHLSILAEGNKKLHCCGLSDTNDDLPTKIDFDRRLCGWAGKAMNSHVVVHVRAIVVVVLGVDDCFDDLKVGRSSMINLKFTPQTRTPTAAWE